MARVRLSTTVDSELLADARRAHAHSSDSAVVDEALRALLTRHRAAEIDSAYAAYDRRPLHEQDDWGDLAAFRRAAGTT
ncbi:type II toxin-antitoxin system VapB family antitoxin [Gaiella sp.]|jgi:Arc/MetJ family transcription regulator|uniref:type II toxin-antitoxin system VapB family antitoxin n=1 Tax=Gaiella sp. TaxID=2663207 RepID=UPI002E334E92|nr:type II toxin-antitoxin system VapB family antitoxin [Gaiella sp.]HEX5582905.1 type II toxin-antitoxin system VapB family antitoxin [Gaiella sp.]